MTTLDQPVLSDDQQTLVGEGLIGSETRAQYFGELVPRLRNRQRWLTVGSLVLSSGAAISLLTSAFPNYNWAKALLAIASAVLSAISLVSSNEKNAIEASDLHYRWQTLATAYRNLWSNMYAEDAVELLHHLQEQEATVSKSSTAMPNITKLVLKAEENVIMHYQTKLPA